VRGDLRAVQALVIKQNKRQRWRQLFVAGVVLMAVMVANAGAQADYRDGERLYADCVPEEADWALFCQAYIAAIADAARHDPVDGDKVCVPADVKLEELVDIVSRSLKAHPENRHFGAAGLVAQALAEAFPCTH
jgi:hypothetical protein